MKLTNFAVPAMFLVAGSLLAAACTIGEVDDIGGFGGFGGDAAGTGGQAAASGGVSAGTGGAGVGGDGPEEFVICGAGSELASVDPVAEDDACTSCQKTKCADEYAACFSRGAAGRAACDFGSTTFTSTDGSTMNIQGEYPCMDSCIKEQGTGDLQAVDDCKKLCGSECGATADQVTVDFVSCVVLGNDEGDDCYSACYD